MVHIFYYCFLIFTLCFRAASDLGAEFEVVDPSGKNTEATETQKKSPAVDSSFNTSLQPDALSQEKKKGARLFRHQVSQGEHYRIMTKVDERVYTNGKFLNNSYIVSNTRLQVSKLGHHRGRPGAWFQADFRISERLEGHFASYSQKNHYQSSFWRNDLGLMEVEGHYFMPVIRHIPTFPERAIVPGDSWSAPGEEAHDFQRYYNLSQPFRFPVDVHYSYVQNVEQNGILCAQIKIRYSIFHKVSGLKAQASLVPVRVTGQSEKVLLWDIQHGRMVQVKEDFDYIFHLSDGQWVEYKGQALRWLQQQQPLDMSFEMAKIRSSIQQQKQPDINVKKSQDGLTIILENIQFQPESYVLSAAEKSKLDFLNNVLKEHQDKTFLISGHTAKVGSAEHAQRISAMRAQAVADYLIALGGVKAHQLITEGKGWLDPIDSQDTPQGRHRNRRVEITILD